MNEIDIIAHPVVQIWLKELAKNEPLKFLSLTEGLIEVLTRTYGNPSGQTQKFKFWKREHLGINIYIYSDELSTYYKAQYVGSDEQFINDKKVGVYITVFLTKLLKDIES